ncbi:MAG: M1 family metallopeptidase [Novosphingobium sp.]|nr:M1 family metallopeptidase [Novosphingobium sp.]MCP5403286.1 M1 family metallopeptidase [Novosphingobium sp.]
MPISRLLIAGALAFAAFAGGAQAQAPSTAPPVEPDASTLPSGRLSDAVRPVAYRLDLTVDPARERFSGRVEIDAVLQQPSRRIVLHGRGLAMHKAAAHFGGELVAGTWRLADPTGVVALTFPKPLPAGKVTLAFDYDAAFNDGPAGMFRVRVDDDWYSWTQFQSIDARAAFPGFDQPSFKTPFTITLRTPPGLMAVSNAPQVSKSTENGLDVHRFAPTLPLPTYLVAMMVGPFSAVESTVPPTQQRSRALPLRIISTRQNAGKLSFALEGSKEIVARLEDYFADAFPYPKLDQITSPVMPGAMENAGADLYRDALIVLDEDAPIPQQRRFGMVVSHELAHQWFGDLVTPAWWDDIWLNESFANWMGYRIGDAWRPELNIRSGALAEGFEAMETDALVAGRPIRQRIETNAQIDGAFDSITYGKGGHVIAMIAAYLGDERFRAGVRHYLAAHRHGNATSADFFAALAEAGGDPRIVEAMQSFTDQQGVPLLEFRRDGDEYIVTQHRYAPFGASPPEAHWDVPFCVRRGAERHCHLLTEKSVSIPAVGAGPLVPNAGGTGYYRFELAARDWDGLIEVADRLPGGEAQAVADSLAASLLAGRAGVSQLADLARKLVHHPDSYASDAASSAMAAMVSEGLVDSGGRRGWLRFRAKLYGPLIKEYGFDPRAGAYSGEDPERTQRRVQIVERLTGSSRGKKLVRKLGRAARDFLEGDQAALDPSWFGVAFDAFVSRRKNAEAADLLLEKALASEDPVFRPAALNAVSTSGMRPVARRLLYELDDRRLRASEKRGMLGGIMSSRATREIGYAWIRENLDELMSGNNGIFFSARLPRMFNRFCSVARADELAETFRPRMAGTPSELELERVIERVRNCGVLRDAHGQEISRGFEELG